MIFRYKLTSVSSLIKRLENHSKSFCYRGQAKDWPLIPSIGRVGRGGFDEILSFEKYIMAEFRRLASPYIDRPPQSIAEWILHAQHHGLPTRLLDWTANPLKALYFAVENDSEQEDSVLWSADARAMEWTEDLPNLNAEATYFHRPAHLNKRLIAQESLFQVFPLSATQTSIIPPDMANIDIFGRVEKFTIPASCKRAMKDTLDQIGINNLSMYQSIEAVAQNIRNVYLMHIPEVTRDGDA
jgi:hypothetical protein